MAASAQSPLANQRQSVIGVFLTHYSGIRQAAASNMFKPGRMMLGVVVALIVSTSTTLVLYGLPALSDERIDFQEALGSLIRQSQDSRDTVRQLEVLLEQLRTNVTLGHENVREQQSPLLSQHEEGLPKDDDKRTTETTFDFDEEGLRTLIRQNQESTDMIRQMEGRLDHLQQEIDRSQKVSDQITDVAGVVHCEGPSLPVNAFHIIVGGYKRKEAGIDIEKNYLWNLGLTNAQIFWYRRVEPERPLRSLSGPCGVRVHERLLYPNEGRDAGALFDYILEHYDSPNPPRAVMYLHGHGARAWHTSCDAVFGRSIYYYRNLAFQKNITTRNRLDKETNEAAKQQLWVGNHMMTLTSHADGTREFQNMWFGFKQSDSGPGIAQVMEWSKGPGNNVCEKFLVRWRDLILSHSNTKKKDSRAAEPFHSCCASFIIPGDRFHRYPRVFYEEIHMLHMTSNDSKTIGYGCFEYIAYLLFGDDADLGEQDESVAANRNETIMRYYDEADSLIHGSSRQPQTRSNDNSPATERRIPDESVLERHASCKQWDIDQR